MKLLVAGIDNPQKVSSWSGIPYHLSQSLAKIFDLCFIGDLIGPTASRHRLWEKLAPRLGMGSHRIRSEPGVLKEFASRMEGVIAVHRPDAILSINCEPIAYLKPGLPAYIIHDATFRLLQEGYPLFQAIGERSRRTGEEAQKRGFARAALTFASSEWARESAVRDYGQPADKVKIIPLGANLTDAPSLEEVVASIDRRVASGKFEFLFVGVEWARKGGDDAVAIVGALVGLGLDARLHLVGCDPPAAVLEKPFVVAHGFLSKNKPEQAAKLRGLFNEASYFIMPSIGDCSPCVLAEANSFGVPCISRKTGGIPEIVRSEETGFLLSDELPMERIIDLVFQLSRNPVRYREMALRARADYEQRLNWDAYAQRVSEIIQPSAALAHSTSTRT